MGISALSNGDRDSCSIKGSRVLFIQRFGKLLGVYRVHVDIYCMDVHRFNRESTCQISANNPPK